MITQYCRPGALTGRAGAFATTKAFMFPMRVHFCRWKLSMNLSQNFVGNFVGNFVETWVELVAFSLKGLVRSLALPVDY